MRLFQSFAVLFVFVSAWAFGADTLRAGIIGADTSHVPEFTKLFNAEKPVEALAGIRVVACFPGGSPDIPASKDRLAGFVEKLKAMNVEIVDSVEALVAKVDVVLIESVDGRPHLQQALPVLKAKKRLFIDKPLAGSLADAIEIYRVAKEQGVPIFSSSSLRFNPDIAKLKDPVKVGDALGCDSYGPCTLEPHHPDLFWYGIHGVETLFTVMGPGCESVTRVQTPDMDFVVGVWRGGRIGTFRGTRAGKHDYGATVFGTKGEATIAGSGGYQPLVEAMAAFFKSGVAPVSAEETLDIYAFMEAADESKREGGKAVSVASVMEKARAQGK